MKVQRASYEIKTAKLASDFGVQMAERWFTAEQLALVPMLKAGKDKGKMRGIIEWKKVHVGGWQRDKNGLGGVQYPGTRDVTIIASVTEHGMTREFRMSSRGRREAQIEADKARAEQNAALRAEIAAFQPQG